MKQVQPPDQAFRSMVSGLRNHAIFTLDQMGRITSWNDGARRIKGFDPAEVLGEHFSRFYTPEDLAWGKPQHELDVAAREGSYEGEGWRVRKDGTRFWASVVITAMYDDAGNINGYAKIVRDLTERQRNEKSLRESEARLRSIVNQAVDGIITINESGVIESVNPAVEKIFGYASDELIGQNVKVLMPNPYHAEHDSYLGNYIRTGQRKIIGIGREVLGRRRDGSNFPVDLTVSEVQHGDRRIFTGIVRDITQRKRSEQALRDSEARHRAILMAAVDGIITIDEHGTIESLNPAAERQFGYTGPELIGQNVKVLMPSPFFEQHDQYLEHYRATGERKIIGIGREVLGKRKDGTTFHMDLAVSELQIGGQRMFTGLVHDITDRKHAEQERDELLERERAARAEAERASEAKDTFMAALSHELRTPLTPALLTLSLLEDHPDLPQQVRDDVASIKGHVELEAHLIDDLLDLTRVVSGKMHLDCKPTNVHQLIQLANETCRQEDGIEVKVELTAQDFYANADPSRLQQVLWNLLSNAHKFTPIDGQITIRSYNVPETGLLCVEVSDTGRGIDVELLPKVFNAFEQGDPRTARWFGGLGLGLAISKAIMTALHGELSVRSAGKGMGATFAVTIATVPAPSSARSTSAADGGAQIQLKSLRVLVVEDHPPTSRILVKLLKQLGHDVTPAATLKEAVTIGTANEFDLLISDVGLPDGSGYDVMRAIKQVRKIPGIALTGYGTTDDVRRSMDAGFTHHLTKPIDIRTLTSAMQQIVEAG